MWESSPGAWIDPACPIEWGCPQTRGLVGMWAAPPNSGWWGGERLRDLTRGARQPKDGILSGMGTSTTSGWVGLPSGLHALAFDGSNDEVNCGANVVYDTTAVTMCAWVRPAAFPNSYNAVFSRTNALNSYKQILVKSTGKLAIYTERAYYDGTGTNTLAAGTTYFLAFTYDSVAGLTGYINGVVDGTAAAGGTLDTTAGLSLYLGRDSGVAGRIWQGLIWDALLFNRALSAAEVRWWYQQGRDGYRDAWRWASSRAYSLPAAGGNAYTLTCGPGSYAYTGSSVGLTAQRKIVLASGDYALTGSSVGLLRGYPLTVGSGSYTITGANVGLRAARLLAPDSGSHALTGSSVGLYRGYPLTIGAGSYTVTGSSVGLTAQRLLALASGSYAVTGSAVGLYRGYPLALGAGSYAITGSTVGLRAARLLALASGSYALTGTDVTLRYSGDGLVLALDSGSYTITGSPVGLLIARRIALDGGSYAFTGSAVAIRAARLLALAPGSYALTGSSVGLLRGYPLTIGSGSYALTGSGLALSVARRLVVGPGSYLITGASVDLDWSGAVVLTGPTIADRIILNRLHAQEITLRRARADDVVLYYLQDEDVTFP